MDNTCKKFGFGTILFLIIIRILLQNDLYAQQTASPKTDVLIVGAGISGLAAAWEAGRGGAKVIVIDMFSVYL